MHVQGLRIRAGRPIHEMGTSHIFDGKGLVKPCGIELRSLEQSRAEQSRAEQSRAEQSRAEQIAPFLELNTKKDG